MTKYDVMKCPKCGSEDISEYNTDECEFDYDGQGHYYVDCSCGDCKEHFRLCMKFTYEITESWARRLVLEYIEDKE